MRFLPAALAVLTFGCAGFGSRVQALPADASAQGYHLLSRSVSLPRGKVAADCGPEALSAVLTFYGKPAPVDEITARIYDADLKGTVPAAMWLEAVERGLAARSTHGSLHSLKEAVDRDTPSIVMVAVRPKMFHFFVVVGYNDRTSRLVAEDYDGGKYLLSYEELAKGWEGARYYCLELLEAQDADTRTGQGLERRGEYAKAIGFYRRALQKDPGDSDALIGLGTSLHLTGDAAGAREAYEKARELAPDDPRLCNNLADLYLTIGERPEEAEKLAVRAVDLYESRRTQLRAELSRAHEYHRPRIRSEIRGTEADLAGAFGTLGQARAANGRHELAIAAWKASLDLMPLTESDRRARRLLEIGKSFRKLGMPAEARSQFQRALEAAREPGLRAAIEAELK